MPRGVYKRTEITKERIRQARLGSRFSEEAKESMRRSRLERRKRLGYINSLETRKKMSIAKKGRPSSVLGKHWKWPEGTKKRMSGRTGEKSNKWVGDKARYGAVHARVYRKRGNPKECEVCGLKDPNRVYHWANLTGHYHNVNDYKRMCVPCHRRYDEAYLNFAKLK